MIAFAVIKIYYSLVNDKIYCSLLKNSTGIAKNVCVCLFFFLHCIKVSYYPF